ncbi:MAG: GNAT family N-acetyltransferase [Myxococcota bacterium]
MEYGIQRRNIYLAPATDEEVLWFCAQFQQQEVWEMFGLDGPSELLLLRLIRADELVLGILWRAHPQKRIGFVVMFPPDANRDYWEFGYAIPEPADRDAFSAMYSTDAMAHYMFEHLNVEAMGWRTRDDNRAADAVIRRLGYVVDKTLPADNHSYRFYRLDRAGWAKRREKLDRGEESHPSGLGSTFVTLRGPPYQPIVPEAWRLEAAPKPEAEAAAPPKAPKKPKAAPAPKPSTKPKEAKKAKKAKASTAKARPKSKR